MTSSIEDILSVAENPAYVRAATARVLLRQDLLARQEELEAEWRAAVATDRNPDTDGIGDVPRSSQLAQALAEFEDEVEDAKVEFRFRSIGMRAWVDLIRDHPPTDAQLAAHRGLDHNPETFPPAAVAASCSEPAMTLEHAQRLQRSLNLTQWALLWQACLNANTQADVGKSVAAGMLRRLNGVSGQRPTTTVSPAASSSAGS